MVVQSSVMDEPTLFDEAAVVKADESTILSAVAVPTAVSPRVTVLDAAKAAVTNVTFCPWAIVPPLQPVIVVMVAAAEVAEVCSSATPDASVRAKVVAPLAIV